jgi:DNA-binding HxlR family transcriptional regulator
MDWQSLRDRLAPLRMRWDLAVLANLADGDGPLRPTDLIEAINAQSSGRQISWKVLEERLKQLEGAGYIARQEVSRIPREIRYRLLPPGRRLISAATMLDAWYSGQEPEPGERSGEREGARQGRDWQQPGCGRAGATTRLSAQGGRLASGTEAAADQWTGRT